MERSRLSAAMLSAALVAAVAAVYGQTAGFEFVALDDGPYVPGNAAVREGLTPETLRWAFTTSYQGSWQPLTWISYMVERELHGLEPGGYHVTNALLHAAAALLAFAAFHALSGALWRSAAVAALLALHPQHVESVAWVAERKGLLAAVFGLGSLWAYAGFARRGGGWRYALCALALLAGLLSKQVVVTLPCVFLLLDFWPLRRWPERSAARLIAEKLPLFALCAGASWMALAVQGEAGGRALAEVIGVGQRVANAAVSIVLHLRHTLWPFGLSPYYPHPYVATTGGVAFGALQVAAAGAALVAITGLALRERERRPWLGVGWLWFAGMLVPSLGLVPFGTHGMADRFAYLPALGLYAAGVWTLGDAARSLGLGRRACAALGLAALAALGTLCWREARHWRDSEALFERVLAVEPRAAMIHYNYANLLKRGGGTERAVEHYRAALEVHPGYLKARTNLANTLRDTDEPEAALAEYQTLAAQYPTYAPPHYQAGLLLAKLGRLEEARSYLERTAELDPHSEEVRAALEALGAAKPTP